MPKAISKLTIEPDVGIGDAMRRLSDGAEKVLFVVDDETRMIGVLSDGNLRRHITASGGITGTVEDCYNREPVVVEENWDPEDVKRKMLERHIEAIPVLDAERRIIDVLLWTEIFSGQEPESGPLDANVVVMAGGRGTRLDPFTRVLPKPLIPIGDKPILELIMDRAAKHGVRSFHVSINKRAYVLKAFFQEKGTAYDINWVEEDEPRGTAGALSQLAGKITGTTLITNCDTIINEPLDDIAKFHKDKSADITLIAALQHFQLSYGVCQMNEGGILESIDEKPKYDFLVNTGMYFVEDWVLDHVPDKGMFDFPDLIKLVKEQGGTVCVYPVNENAWIDVGEWDEYRKAVQNLSIDS